MIKSLFSVFAVFAVTTAFADPVASDDFSSAELSKSWAVAKGTWKVVDDKLSGAELASDDHVAVITYKAPHIDSKVKFSFQLNGSKGFGLSFNHPKGHLYRVNVTQAGAQVNLDKDKKDPASKAIALAKAEGKFKQGETYTMTCENVGDTVKVEFDNGVKLEAKHEKLTNRKTGYRLVLKGEGVLFDDFTVLSSK